MLISALKRLRKEPYDLLRQKYRRPDNDRAGRLPKYRPSYHLPYLYLNLHAYTLTLALSRYEALAQIVQAAAAARSAHAVWKQSKCKASSLSSAVKARQPRQARPHSQCDPRLSGETLPEPATGANREGWKQGWWRVVTLPVGNAPTAAAQGGPNGGSPSLPPFASASNSNSAQPSASTCAPAAALPCDPAPTTHHLRSTHPSEAAPRRPHRQRSAEKASSVSVAELIEAVLPQPHMTQSPTLSPASVLASDLALVSLNPSTPDVAHIRTPPRDHQDQRQREL